MCHAVHRPELRSNLEQANVVALLKTISFQLSSVIAYLYSSTFTCVGYPYRPFITPPIVCVYRLAASTCVERWIHLIYPATEVPVHDRLYVHQISFFPSFYILVKAGRHKHCFSLPNLMQSFRAHPERLHTCSRSPYESVTDLVAVFCFI